jgi:hypothetical protein
MTCGSQMSSSRMFFSPWMELRWSTVLRQGRHHHATPRSSQRGPLPTEAAVELARGSRRRQAAAPGAPPTGVVWGSTTAPGGAGRCRRPKEKAGFSCGHVLNADLARRRCRRSACVGEHGGEQPNRFLSSHLLAHQE